MKNPNTKRKFRAVLIAAVVGAVLFAAVHLAIVKGESYFSGQSGGPDLSLIIIGALPYLVTQALGLAHAPLNSFVNSTAFDVIVNSLFGALIFFIGATFWQFIVKSNREIKN